MRNGLVARHADTVIGNGDGALILVVFDTNTQIGITLEQLGIINGFKTQLVASVRRIGHEFTQEYFFVAIQ
ncbi:hypothetical protein D3C78_1820110 [compost metagenome]